MYTIFTYHYTPLPADMDVSGQEELVSLIFGDSPPDGWREAPEFQIYLQVIL